jgi:hypothetical protein
LERFFSFGAFLQFSDLIEKEKSRGSAERHAFLILRLREGESGRGTERRRRKIARTREGGTGSLGADEGMGQTVQNAVRRFVWGWCVSPCLFFVVAVSLHLDRPVSGQRHWDREKIRIFAQKHRDGGPSEGMETGSSAVWQLGMQTGSSTVRRGKEKSETSKFVFKFCRRSLKCLKSLGCRFLHGQDLLREGEGRAKEGR